MADIRSATMDDLGAVLAMGAQFYESSGYEATHGPFDASTAYDTAVLLLERGVLLLAEVEGEPVGMIGLVLAPFLFNRARISAHEVMWWVDPGNRTSNAGLSLIRAAEVAVRAAGAVSIQMIHLDTSPAAAAVVYRRLGYRQTESMYTKGL